MKKKRTRSRRERGSRHSPSSRNQRGKKLAILTIAQVVIAFVAVGLFLIQRGKAGEAGAALGIERRISGINKASYATDDRGDGYVSKKEYQKLKQEVQTLKSQMQRLLEILSATSTSKPAAAKAGPVTSASKPAVAEAKEKKKPVPTPPPSKPSIGQSDQEEFALKNGDRRKEAEEAKRELDQFLRAQKLLFKPGEVQLELGAFYAQDTAVKPVFPTFISRFASVNFLIRYGLAENLEFDFGVPLVYTEQERDAGLAGRIFGFPSSRGAGVGIGDLSGALRYAAVHEASALPEVTVNVNAKSDTGDVDRGLGTGQWNVGTGVSLVKTIDPVVLFGSLGYTRTLGTLELEGGDVDFGDQILYSMGMGFSLNDRVSFSMAMDGAAIRRTKLNGGEITGSGLDANSLQLATTVQLAKRVYLEPVVGFGLTDDAPDFMVGINVPFGLEGRVSLPFFHNL